VRASRYTVVLLLAALLSACMGRHGAPPDHPRFGAADFQRDGTTASGQPTYSISGTLAFRETAEEKVAQVMQSACPDGNPRIVSGFTATGQSMPRRWYAQFSCDHEITLE
jgi:hypothetical protein